MSLNDLPLAFILGGAVVGFIVGATGVGGGSLMTPLLTLAFGVPAQVAVGTDLLFAAVTKANGVRAHSRRGNVHWPITMWMIAGSVPASVATLAAMRNAHIDTRSFDLFVSHALGATLLLTATGLLLQRQIRAIGLRLVPERAGAGGPALLATAPLQVGLDTGGARPLPTMLLGAVIGGLVTLTSVGAGVIGVVALLFLYPSLETRRIVGADVAHAVPLTLIAGLGHAALGTVNWSMLVALLIGSVPAIGFGAAAAHRLPDRALRAALAAMLVLLGLRLLLK